MTIMKRNENAGSRFFSKQAEFIWNDTSITILDTPGHVDFSAEMERVLQVLDCAVLVVSAVDGVQAHTVTLWRLLKQYKIPTMIFVNKMDRQEADREKLLEELKTDSETAVWRWTCSRRRTKKVLRCVMRQCLRNIYPAGRSKRRSVKKGGCRKESISVLVWFCFESARNRSADVGIM